MISPPAAGGCVASAPGPAGLLAVPVGAAALAAGVVFLYAPSRCVAVMALSS